MNIVIVEDEPNAAKQLERMLLECDSNINILASLGSVKNTVEWLISHETPELLFLDIQLADGLSFDIFEQCNIECPIIFCTAFDQYAIRAFKVNSIDYLLKPLEKDALLQSLTKYKKLRNSEPQTKTNIENLLQQIADKTTEPKSRFMVKYRQEFLSVDAENIAYFYIQHKIINLVTLEGKSYAIEHPLDELEKMVDTRHFFRINRQTLISIKAIINVETDFGRLSTIVSTSPKRGFSVSRDKTAAFKKWFGH